MGKLIRVAYSRVEVSLIRISHTFLACAFRRLLPRDLDLVTYFTNSSARPRYRQPITGYLRVYGKKVKVIHLANGNLV